MQVAQLQQHLRRDADRCRRQRHAGEEGGHHVVAVRQHDYGGEGHRHHHAQYAGEDRHLAHLGQLAEVNFQADVEHQQQHAQLGEFLNRPLQINTLQDAPVQHVQHRRAQNDADDQLAQHTRLTQAAGDSAAGS